MATFGKTNIGSSSTAYNTGNKRGSKFTLSENGTVTDINIYATNTKENVKFAIYADSAGSPSALKYADDTGQTMVNGWNTKSGLSVALTAGDYWLCWSISGSDITFYYDAGPRAWNTHVYADAFPDPFGTPSSDNTRLHSIYCTYTPEGAPAGQPYISRVQQISGMQTFNPIHLLKVKPRKLI